jgi:hypothetical protein
LRVVICGKDAVATHRKQTPSLADGLTPCWPSEQSPTCSLQAELTLEQCLDPPHQARDTITAPTTPVDGPNNHTCQCVQSRWADWSPEQGRRKGNWYDRAPKALCTSHTSQVVSDGRCAGEPLRVKSTATRRFDVQRQVAAFLKPWTGEPPNAHAEQPVCCRLTAGDVPIQHTVTCKALNLLCNVRRHSDAVDIFTRHTVRCDGAQAEEDSGRCHDRQRVSAHH